MATKTFLTGIIVLILIATSHTVGLATDYRVGGFSLGENIYSHELEQDDLSCNPSKYEGLTWCNKTIKERHKGKKRTRFVTVAHDENGRILYATHILRPIKDSRRNILRIIRKLSQKYRKNPQVYSAKTYLRKGEFAIIAVWGDISLKKLNRHDIDLMDQGGSANKGYIVDFLVNFKRSRKENLPLFSIEGNRGLIFSVHLNRRGRGVSSWRIVEPNRISKYVQSYRARVVSLQDWITDSLQAVSTSTSIKTGAIENIKHQLRDPSIFTNLNKLESLKNHTDSVLHEEIEKIKKDELIDRQEKDFVRIAKKIESINADSPLTDNQNLGSKLSLLAQNLKDTVVNMRSNRQHQINQEQIDQLEKKYSKYLNELNIEKDKKRVIRRLRKIEQKYLNQQKRILSKKAKLRANKIITQIAGANLEMSYPELRDIEMNSQKLVSIFNEADNFETVRDLAYKKIETLNATLSQITSDNPVILDLEKHIKSTEEAIKESDTRLLRTTLGQLNRYWEKNGSRIKSMAFKEY